MNNRFDKYFIIQVLYNSFDGSKNNVCDSRRYGSEPIEGLTVWGKWDSELYVKLNEDVEGEHGWSHFRSESFVSSSQHTLIRRCRIHVMPYRVQHTGRQRYFTAGNTSYLLCFDRRCHTTWIPN